MHPLLIVVAVLIALWAIAWLIGSRLPETHQATRSALFHQTPEMLWETILAPEKLPGWRNGVPLERVEAIPNEKLVMRVIGKGMPFGGTWVYEITPEGNVARLRVTENGEIYNPIFRAMTRFLFGYTRSMEAFLKAVGRKFNEPATIEN